MDAEGRARTGISAVDSCVLSRLELPRGRPEMLAASEACAQDGSNGHDFFARVPATKVSISATVVDGFIHKARRIRANSTVSWERSKRSVPPPPSSSV